MSDFVHLHCHSEYSMLDGALRVDDLVRRAKEYHMPKCAVTDHGNMFAAAAFQAACRKYGIKPIFGCELYTCNDHLDRTSELARIRNHLILLAMNRDGYRNLTKMVSTAWIDGFYYKPRIDWNVLKDHSEGLICLSACLQGEIPQAILKGDMDKAREITQRYAKLFPDRFYLELQSNGLRQQTIVNDALRELSESEGVPLIATNDCHYLDEGDWEAQEILMCIGMGTTLNEKHFKIETHELYYKSPETMYRQFAGVEVACENTLRVAEQCNYELSFGKHFFPRYPLAEGQTPETEFRRLSEIGLERRMQEMPYRKDIDDDLYRERLQYEIGVILDMGFPSYFLIVQEFINWAKNNGVPTGPGRGSAAGSIVAWALRITNLDPIPYNLLFERFLNIERISLPDIDVDFCERRRYQVINHMADTYGEDAVCQIAAFGKLKARAVIHDVGRVLGMDFKTRAAVAKQIPAMALKIHISEVLEKNEELKSRYDNEKDVHKLLDISQRLEGLTRQASMHAAGLVVSDKPMEEYLPIFQGKHGEQVTQFDGPMVEQIGLVKFDFLGLKTMTLLNDALDNIRLEGKEVPNLDLLPFTDQDTFDLYSKGDTDGIFQVEGEGMRQYLRMLCPSCFEDLIAMLALYRPGPLGSGMVDEFIARKHGDIRVTYPHDSLFNCLKDTYGIIVYQEQVMQIAQLIAGYTLGGADLLRRAMGKKKVEVMASERITFVKGADAKGINENKANEIFDLMEKFAAYGFNKSHSAAYAQISYYTAWLKVHYTAEFMAALLTSEMGNQDKLMRYLACCRSHEVPVVPPSVNLSKRHFYSADGCIIYGFGGVKNVGDEAVQEIVDERAHGVYTSLYDFCRRVNLRKVTKRVLESLVKCGAFDFTGATRAALLASLDTVLSRAQKGTRAKAKSQTPNNGNSMMASLSLLAPAELAAQNAPAGGGIGIDCEEANMEEMPDKELLAYEKESLGFYFSSHPLMLYFDDFERLSNRTLESLETATPAKTVHSAVLVTSIREVMTKKSELMAFVEIEDLTGHAEVTFFPKAYTPAVRGVLKSEEPVCIIGRIDPKSNEDDGDREPDTMDDMTMDGDDEELGETFMPPQGAKKLKLLGSGARLMREVCAECSRPVHLRIPASHLGRSAIEGLRNVLERYKGNVPFEPQVDLDGKRYTLTIDPSLTVRPGPDFNQAFSEWAEETDL